MKVRVLVEQRADDFPRGYLASGAEVELPNDEALALIGRGHAEPLAVKPEARAEKRPSVVKREKRG